MAHYYQVERYDGSLQQLAEDIGDLRYDALSDFLNLLSEKIKQDGVKDGARGRAQLAPALQDCAEQLGQASTDIGKAWRICEPYMPTGDPTGSPSAESDMP